MNKPNLFDMLREWIAGVAFNIFLWAIHMTVDEYRMEMLEDARREYQSEKENAWLMK